ncbi:Butyrophilin subfamily 3 member A3 Precursor [Channa argus]|uniref:Butyrophilin subfamily 3 member A3 n=1 Tax=Channa argus TaxID=215402 RepID=A0A6G1Q6Q3_CHAAH|nr:Butyrophilin subfamily 3 member A3 Precursor [Channa argus]
MYYRVFLVSALLTCCAGESLAHGPPENIFAFEGGDVILPCSFNITASSDFPTVEWSKEDLKPNVVFLYRDGCETYEMKDRAFEYRTSLIPKELKNGNISLRISNVRLSDAGTYQCMTLGRNMRRSIKKIELTVFFEPKLSVVSAECGGLTLQCEAKSSLSEPEITFLDDLGNNIAAEEAKRDEDAGGIYTVRRRVTLHSATNSITCRVYQPEFSLAKDQRMLIPADFRRCCFLIGISCVAVTLFLSVLVAGCVWKMCGKSAKAQKSVSRQESDMSVNTSILEGQSFLGVSFNIDNVVNSSNEELERELDRLRSELLEQKQTNSELQNKLKSLDSNIRPVVCQDTQPKVGRSAPEYSLTDFDPNPITNNHTSEPTASIHKHPPKSSNICQKNHPQPNIQKQNQNLVSWNHAPNRTRSSPARLSIPPLLSSSSKKTQVPKGRSQSDPIAPLHDLNSTELHQRYHQSSPLCFNRYSPLANLKEDPELVKTRRKTTKQF